MIIKLNERGICYLWKFGNDLERNQPNFQTKLDPNTSVRELKDLTKVFLIRSCDRPSNGGWVLVRVVEDGDVGWVRCGWLYGE